MTDSGSSSPPPSRAAQPAPFPLKDSGDMAARILNVTGDLKNNPRLIRLEGEVVSQSKDGTITVKTENGTVEMQVRARDIPVPGVRIEIDIPPGKPPRQAVVRPAPEQPQRPASGTPAQSAPSSAAPARAAPPPATPLPPVSSSASAPAAPPPDQPDAPAPLPPLASSVTTRLAEALPDEPLPPLPQMPLKEGDVVRLLPLTAEKFVELIKVQIAHDLKTLWQPLAASSQGTSQAGAAATTASTAAALPDNKLPPLLQKLAADGKPPSLEKILTAFGITPDKQGAIAGLLKPALEGLLSARPALQPLVSSQQQIIPAQTAGTTGQTQSTVPQGQAAFTPLPPSSLATPAPSGQPAAPPGMTPDLSAPLTAKPDMAAPPVITPQAAADAVNNLKTTLPLLQSFLSPPAGKIAPERQAPLDVQITKLFSAPQVSPEGIMTAAKATAGMPVPHNSNPQMLPASGVMPDKGGTPVPVMAQTVMHTPQNLPVMTITQTGKSLPDVFIMQFPAANLMTGDMLEILPQAMKPALPPTQLPPLTLRDFFGTFSWPVFEDLATFMPPENLQAAAAHTALQARMALPNPAAPVQMNAAALLFIAAVRSGDIGSWLGDRMTDTIRRAGRTDILGRLTREADTLNRLTAEPVSQDWRAMALPLQWENDIHKMMLYYRHDKGDGTEDGEKKQSTRFIFDLNLQRLGAVQMDGLHRDKKLDLIVRTHKPLSSGMQQAMRLAYATALGKTDLHGELSFQGKPEQFIKMDMPVTHSQITI